MAIGNQDNFDPDDMPNWLSTFFSKSNYSKVIAGINDDDCAILKIGNNQIVISTDFLNANPIAIEFGIGTFEDLGKLLVAANLSDLCGTGAKPIGFLCSIMLEKETASKKEFKLLMKGIKELLDKFSIPLIGGDTKLGNSNSFCGVAIGNKERGSKLFLKNSAKVGDSIWVSSEIGNVSAAISGLQGGGMDEKWCQWAKKSIITPNIPLELSMRLAKSRIGEGGTDLSDGLGADLWALCEASNVGAIIDADSIPTSPNVNAIAAKRNIPSWYYAFTVGGDFQFLVTAKRINDKRMEKLGFKKIGEVIEEKEAYIRYNNSKYKMPKIGHRDSRTSSFSNELLVMTEALKKHFL